jgi:hypothetical protein
VPNQVSTGVKNQVWTAHVIAPVAGDGHSSGPARLVTAE